jgi:hypothetical protein
MSNILNKTKPSGISFIDHEGMYFSNVRTKGFKVRFL